MQASAEGKDESSDDATSDASEVLANHTWCQPVTLNISKLYFLHQAETFFRPLDHLSLCETSNTSTAPFRFECQFRVRRMWCQNDRAACQSLVGIKSMGNFMKQQWTCMLFYGAADALMSLRAGGKSGGRLWSWQLSKCKGCSFTNVHASSGLKYKSSPEAERSEFVKQQINILVGRC